MAHLLGSQFCIESLRNDVTDLQESVVDVFSRVGPVRCPSWKYPDKVSADIDLTELLEMYDYSGDEEERQVAHIVLMEMVIDRMVLLLQSMSKYLEQMSSVGKAGPSAKQSSSNTSIGLVVKKYWTKMVTLHSLVQQLQSENKSKSRKIAELETQLKRLDAQSDQLKTKNLELNSTLNGIAIPLNNAADSRLSNASRCTISRDDSNKACQTIETAFVPCESCHLVQKNFREVGDAVINICQTQNLPSSLAKHKHRMEGIDWLSGNDVAMWSSEQGKDLSRINKHLDYLMGTIDPLKTDLQREKTRAADLKDKVANFSKELKLERETQSAQIRNYEGKLKETERRNQDYLGAASREKEEVLQGKAKLEKQLGQMREELRKQQDMMGELDTAKSDLEAQLQESLTNNAQAQALEGDIQALHGQLREVNGQLDTATRDLNKERAKNKSVSKHSESLQGKQGSLLQRLDVLDQENEEMRGQVAELEDVREQLEESLERAEGQRSQLEEELRHNKAVVAELSSDKERLEQSMVELRQDISQLEDQVQEARDHEKLLVGYPDLHGPVNHDLTGTGDLSKDMENQVKANSVRIQILEEENSKLRNSITKMLHAQGRQGGAQLGGPVPLWRNPAQEDSPPYANTSHNQGVSKGYRQEAFVHQQRPSDDSSPDNRSPDTDNSASPAADVQHPSIAKYNFPPRPPRKEKTAKPRDKEDVFMVGKGSRSSQGQRSRPPSGGGDSVAAYAKLKKAGLLQGKNRPSSTSTAAPPGESKEYQHTDTYVCHKCDKMYTSARDLEVHRSYCFGGI